MNKSALLIILCLTTYSNSSLSFEKPSMSKDIEDKFIDYMGDANVNAFVCSNNNEDYTILKKKFRYGVYK